MRLGKFLICLSLWLPFISTTPGWANSIASVKLDDLFTQADQVALVKIVSGDSENYQNAVYKAVVEEGYKGASRGDTIFFGPFIGFGVGSEYVLFLKKGDGESPNQETGLSYGDLQHVSREMYDGYASLPVSYECVFDGRDINQQCDYAVQLNPEQVILPKGLKAFSVGESTAVTNYKKWVRKGQFLAYLLSYNNDEKNRAK